MSDAEVHLLWARLLPWEKGSMGRVGQQLDEASASDPASPEVRYLRAIFFLHEDRLDEAGREIDGALAAHPDEPRYLLARVAWYEQRGGAKPGRAPADLVDHLARTAVSAYQLRAAASHQRRSEDGLRLIDRALTADPLCWPCLRTRALMLATAGRIDEALVAADRVTVLLPDGAPAEIIVKLRQEIERARSAAKREAEGAPSAAP
jgi:tetratricopeptide (TPR) repeat protein